MAAGERGLMPREQLGGIPESQEMAGPASLPLLLQHGGIGTAPGHTTPITPQHTACHHQCAAVFTPHGLVLLRTLL